MKKKAKKAQYTVRSIPASVDRALRKMAEKKGQSLNSLLVELAMQATGQNAKPRVYHDLDAFIGTWIKDPETEQALADQRKIEPGDWT